MKYELAALVCAVLMLPVAAASRVHGSNNTQAVVGVTLFVAAMAFVVLGLTN